ncbi:MULTISPECIES: hypothetical protein [Klebsiella]|uniref:hypothetical protein n=1 Tax=Klebsiella TaxID=570 RepID=UPI001E444776|nr:MULTISPECIES: hypothetical protein [Klebsiella]MCW9635324.1 hypothetical protein [Klebsiella oxytoca]MEB8077974.1 hypothetical protein [Klebsiella michiganensis]UNF63730.1 hypothetical protein MMY94_19615 [Klebsiella michiganensis]
MEKKLSVPVVNWLVSPGGTRHCIARSVRNSNSKEGKRMSEVIFSFDNSSDAVRAGKEMNKVDPSLRYMQMRTTVCVIWHANIIAATQAVLDAGIPCTFQYWNDIKNSHRRG